MTVCNVCGALRLCRVANDASDTVLMATLVEIIGGGPSVAQVTKNATEPWLRGRI